jgi:hypothetical protein
MKQPSIKRKVVQLALVKPRKKTPKYPKLAPMIPPINGPITGDNDIISW